MARAASVCWLLAAAAPLLGGEVTFRAAGGEVLEGEEIACEVRIDTATPEVYGWSYGVRFDAGLLEPIDMASLEGALTVNGGAPADWDLHEICADGVSRGVIIDMMVETALPVGTGFRDFGITFVAADLPPDALDPVGAEVRPCHEEVCDPPTRAVWTDAEGTSTLADLVPAEVSIYPRIRAFAYTTPSAPRIAVDPASGESFAPLVARIRLQEIFEGPGGDPSPVQAFYLGMGFDPAEISPLFVEQGSGLSAFHGGAGPDYFHAGIETDCFYAAATISLAEPWQYIIAVPAVELIRVVLDVPAGAYAGLESPAVAHVPFGDSCGEPQVANRVVVEGEDLTPRDLAGHGMAIAIDPLRRIPFIRGDVNVDGRVDLSDPVWLTNELFRSGAQGSCRAAKDANGDGLVDVSDIIYLVGYMLQHVNGPPPAPYPSCGLFEDQSEDDCASYPPCER